MNEAVLPPLTYRRIHDAFLMLYVSLKLLIQFVKGYRSLPIYAVRHDSVLGANLSVIVQQLDFHQLGSKSCICGLVIEHATRIYLYIGTKFDD